MKKLSYLIIIVLISSLAFTGCTLLSNISQVPATEQSGVAYLTKGVPLSVDLVGLWRFDGNAEDSSGNSNDGIVYGGESYVDSPMGWALSFDGDGDYVQLPASNNILNVNTFTIEAWFKTSVNHPVYGVYPYEGRLVNLHWKDTESTAVSLYVEKDKIRLLYNKCIMDHVWVTHTVNYYDNVWHHIAVTYDATTYRLYYDGVEVESQAGDFGGFGTYPAYLGTYNGSQRFFNGLIDEVRIWKVALLPNQLGFYGFNGLLPPYVETKAFKAGRSIPLKWQYTDLFGNVVESFVADPSVKIEFVNGNGNGDYDLIDVDYPGNSGYQYDWETNTWQFNWQTKELPNGTGDYQIWITSAQTGQVNGPFPIQLR